MTRAAILAMTITISGCTGEIPKEVGGRVLCDTLSQKAYVAKPHVGDVIVLQRVAAADPLCKGRT